MPPSLRELLSGLEYELLQGSLDVPVSDVVADSRQCVPNSVFVCLPGYRAEGGEQRADRHEFIPDALARGAAALVVERPVAVTSPVTLVRVRDAWCAVAHLASRFYGAPAQQLVVVGVTGTSGKTSTTYFVEAVFAAAGWTTARIGTIEHCIGSSTYPARQTTPEAPELQRLLREAVSGGCRAVVLEVSSHALELQRVGGIAFDVAVFTNLGRDHLNFHPDFEHYKRAKGKLFAGLGSGGKNAVAVINIDDPHSGYMLEVNRGRPMTYGSHPSADVRMRDVVTTMQGSRFVACTPKGEVAVTLPVPGAFQVYNALAAVAVGVALDFPLAVIADGLPRVRPIPGRFEVVNPGDEFLVVVDYAHKPDALERVLREARSLGPRRLTVVFGCGGDRDRGKRPLMGAIAARLSDAVVLTSDNPRTESPQAIIDDVLAGIPPPQRGKVQVVVDREAAIRAAIGSAHAGDLVVIAGKGHETYQLFAGRRVPFDDRGVARGVLAERRAALNNAAPAGSSCAGTDHEERS